MTPREEKILKWIEEEPMISKDEIARRLNISVEEVKKDIESLKEKGYILGRQFVVKKEPYVLVFGGVNVDIGGTPFKKLVKEDSNPGFVHTTFGGVGRNIAHDMALLSLPVEMLTALGNDDNAKRIENHCARIGIHLEHALRVPDMPTSTYLYIEDIDGKMVDAIAAMDIYERLDTKYLESEKKTIDEAGLIVIDTNPPEETIAELIENAKVPVIADAVSTAKAVKLKEHLKYITALKVNGLEAETYTGIKVTGLDSAIAACKAIVNLGVKYAFLTLGSKGAVATSENEVLHLPPYPMKAINTTGCGDAFTAGVAYGIYHHYSLEDTLKAGLSTASFPLERESAVNEEMTELEMLQRAGLAK